ncbi:MAG: hypothetical protein QM831_26930 [Kofleriaceae bacterium]
MLSITPCQRKISDRFPVASFVVNVPSNRLFEIVCATEPELLRPEYRGRRSTANFFTSRSSGLLRAPAGHATYLVPADQLKRFAGKRRVYYVLASYDNARGDDVQTSAKYGGELPSIQLSADFTGKSLDRSRIRSANRDGKYGSSGPAPVLTWGGDKLATPPPSPPPIATAADYDDGFSPDLWTSATPPPVAAAATSDDDEPEIVSDDAGLGEAYGRPTARPQIVTSAPRANAIEGFEDPAALRRAGASYGRVTVAAPMVEPPGIEHVREAAYGRRFGGDDATPHEPAGAEDVRAPATTPRAEPAWAGEDDEPDLVAAPGTDGEPLTIKRKFEILAPAAQAESGDDRYSAVRGNDEGQGLRWGLVLFSQRSGQLGKVLAACERRDPAQFRQVFGAQHADRLLQVTTATTPEGRMHHVGGGRLWSPEWQATFRAAGAITPFQAAQNEVAIEDDFDRNLGFAAALGLITDRALAIVFDRTIELGHAGARRWILTAISPIVDDATRTTALTALGHADLSAFQRAAGLAPTGQLGSQTHAALLGALRGLGDRAPFPAQTTIALLDRLVTAATGLGFEARVRALRTSAAFTDAVQRIV